MGFTQATTYEQRRGYNLADPIDREIVRVFECELEDYEKREPVTVMKGTIFEKKLKGYELYLHSKDLFRYSRQYPAGAIVEMNIGQFRDAEMKKKAVDSLRFNRQEK